MRQMATFTNKFLIAGYEEINRISWQQDENTAIDRVTFRWGDDASGVGTCWLVASDLEADDVYAAIEIAMDAARPFTRGYTPVGTRTAERVGDLLVVRQDYRTTWPLNGDGTVWCVSSGNRHALVDLSGSGVTAEERDGVGASFSVSESFAQEASATPTSAASQGVPEGTALLERSGVRLAVPEGWYDTDGIEGSERWTVGWAMIDDDEIIQARLLVAPSMPQESVSLALAQIEVDHQAGSLDGLLHAFANAAGPHRDDGGGAHRLRFRRCGRRSGVPVGLHGWDDCCRRSVQLCGPARHIGPRRRRKHLGVRDRVRAHKRVVL